MLESPSSSQSRSMSLSRKKSGQSRPSAASSTSNAIMGRLARVPMWKTGISVNGRQRLGTALLTMGGSLELAAGPFARRSRAARLASGDATSVIRGGASRLMRRPLSLRTVPSERASSARASAGYVDCSCASTRDASDRCV